MFVNDLWKLGYLLLFNTAHSLAGPCDISCTLVAELMNTIDSVVLIISILYYPYQCLTLIITVSVNAAPCFNISHNCTVLSTNV